MCFLCTSSSHNADMNHVRLVRPHKLPLPGCCSAEVSRARWAGRTKNLPGRRALSGHVLPFSCPGHRPCNGSSGPTCRFGGSRCSGGANRPCAVVRSLADGLQTASRLLRRELRSYQPAACISALQTTRPAVAPVQINPGRRSGSLDDRAALHGPISRFTRPLPGDTGQDSRGRHSRSRAGADRVCTAIALMQTSISYRRAKDRSCRTGVSSKIYAQRVLGRSSEHCHVPGELGAAAHSFQALFHSGSLGALHAVVITAPGRLVSRFHRWNVSDENGVATQIVLRAVLPR